MTWHTTVMCRRGIGAGEPLAPLTSAPNTARRERQAQGSNIFTLHKTDFDSRTIVAARLKYASQARETLALYAGGGARVLCVGNRFKIAETTVQILRHLTCG